jgi:hypothetical protein
MELVVRRDWYFEWQRAPQKVPDQECVGEKLMEIGVSGKRASAG